MTYPVRGNALNIPLKDESVDLIVTSPPYWGLRSYRDGDEHYVNQLGSEATVQEWLAGQWAVTAEMKRVLKPSGSIWVNLGDKYARSGGYNQSSDGIRAKSLMGLPWRYAIGCIDQLDLILRAEVIWDKPTGIPEPVTDRVRRSHEQWFHFTKGARYFSGIDEIREVQTTPSAGAMGGGRRKVDPTIGAKTWRHSNGERNYNPLGKLPGSVWRIPSEPLIIPEWAREKYNLPDHFAAFPQEWPRKLILAFSPSGICTECGQGRHPVTSKTLKNVVELSESKLYTLNAASSHLNNRKRPGDVMMQRSGSNEATITGYSCACTPFTDHKGRGKSPIPSGTDHAGRQQNLGKFADGPRGGRVGAWREYHFDAWTPPPTRKAVVLDPFGGTGTVAMVAKQLGRIGISLDLSSDYSRLAQWRIANPPAKIMSRTWQERQEVLNV